MATYRAVTRSRQDGNVEKPDKVRDLLEEYYVRPNVAIEDRKLEVWGHTWFDVLETQDGERVTGEVRTREFLIKLSEMIDGELLIKSIGHMALRHIDAQLWKVSAGDVYLATLEDEEKRIS